MISHFMAMAMDRPVKVLLQSMRMTMLSNHLGMVGDNLEDRGDVTCAWRDGPDSKRQAKKRRKRTPSKCPQLFHRFGLPARSQIAAR
jgi:hypothetical protein